MMEDVAQDNCLGDGADGEYKFYPIAVRHTREGKQLSENLAEVIRDLTGSGPWRLVQVLDLSDHVDPRFELIFSRTTSK